MTTFEHRWRAGWLALAWLLLGALDAGAQTLKIATVAPEGSAWMREMRKAAERVQQRSEGRVQIKYYPGGVMGNDATVIRKIRLGQLQGGALTGSSAAALYKGAQLYSLPFLFRQAGEIDGVRAEFDGRLIEGFREAGFQPLSISGVGFAYLMSNASIGRRSDLLQRKVWVPQDDLIAEQTFRAGGITPVPLPLPDVFTALQTGLIDTIGNTPAGAIALQWHGSLKQVLDLPLSYVIGYILVDRRAFERLPEADRAIVLEAFAQGGAAIDAGNREGDAAAMRALQGLGVQLQPASAEDVQFWTAVGTRVIDQLISEQRIDAALVADLRQRLARLRADG